MFLHSLAFFLSVWLSKNKFQVPNFLFSSLLQLGRGKYNVPTATENLQGERLPYKVFRANLGKFWQNILRTLK